MVETGGRRYEKTGILFSPGSISSRMVGKNPFRTTLIAPCGMNCAICSAFLRRRTGAGGALTRTAAARRNCTIAACEQVKRTYFHDCGNFPCRRLKQLDKRYRTKYHMSMLDNLAAIQKNGIRAFVRSERERWTCADCGGTIDVHHYRCSVCGKVPD